MSTFGSTLKELMKSKKITHAALGRSVGVHRTTIGDYVNDKYLPTEETFHRIHQVIPDKELYDAFFAATKPKDRKVKPLIQPVTSYNFYKAKEDVVTETRNFINAAKEEYNNNLIAHALAYVVSTYETENLMSIAPNDYESYKALLDTYRKYLT